MSSLRLGRDRCAAEIAVTSRSLLPVRTPAETVRCERAAGHDEGCTPTYHLATVTRVRRRPFAAQWEIRGGHAVLVSPDNVVEVPR